LPFATRKSYENQYGTYQEKQKHYWYYFFTVILHYLKIITL